MRKLRKFMPALVSAALVLASCEALDKVSDVPEIKFKSFTMYDLDTLGFTIKTGELVFSFIDGDADFGINTSDNPEDTLNLFLVAYKKEEGIYDSVDADTYGRKYSVLNDENMTRTGQNKTIKGEIKLQVYYFITPPFDTLRYDFYILDRAGNKSNVANTSDISF
jgi:hypothetical protein